MKIDRTTREYLASARQVVQRISETLNIERDCVNRQRGMGSQGPIAALLATLFLISLATTSALAQALQKPLEIKVVIVNMFEVNLDTADDPGEHEYWVERLHLDTVLQFPQTSNDLRLNPHTGVLGVQTGAGTARSAATIMALGLDPRFDLTHAYFLIAGIGSIDPKMGSLASVVWSDYIVDGDLAREIDAREIPKGWKTGYVPLGQNIPYEQPSFSKFLGENNSVYHLNSSLVSWAFNLTKDTRLIDTPEIASRRMQFADWAARQPPFVLRGDSLSADTSWHGKLLNQWARDWVKYQTEGKATYAITTMEDAGTLQSLSWLAKDNKLDINRVLVLRPASNYDQQRTGITAAESLAEITPHHYSAYIPSMENVYRVANIVIDSLVANWPQTRDYIPTK